MTPQSRKRLGDTLIEMGIIDQTTLNRALDRQKDTGQRLGLILEQMEVLLEEDIAKALAKQFGFRYAKGLARYQFPAAVLDLCDAETAIRNLVFPLKIEGKTLYLAMTDPLDIRFQDDLSFKIGLNITPCVSSPSEIKRAIQKNYRIEIDVTDEEKTWNLLVVDDQEMVRKTTAATLKKEGYNVYTAENGAEGLKKALEVKPQLIITDIMMPRMNGEEMFRALQNNYEVASTPVIAVSSKATPEEEYRLLQMGFSDFIAKPLNPLRLIARVQRVMRSH